MYRQDYPYIRIITPDRKFVKFSMSLGGNNEKNKRHITRLNAEASHPPPKEL